MNLRTILPYVGIAVSTAVLGTSPAQAGTATPLPSCPMLGSLLSDLLPGGSQEAGCSVGDKNFYDFQYTGVKSADSIAVAIGGGASNHTLNFTGLGATNYWSQGGGMLSYKAEVNTNSSNFIYKLTGGMTTSLSGTSATGDIITSQPTVAGGACSGTVSFDCTASGYLYSPITTMVGVTNEFQVSSGGATGITQISNTIYQKVPGPLPVMGAAAAFGFSRKLRRTIRAAS